MSEKEDFQGLDKGSIRVDKPLTDPEGNYVELPKDIPDVDIYDLGGRGVVIPGFWDARSKWDVSNEEALDRAENYVESLKVKKERARKEREQLDKELPQIEPPAEEKTTRGLQVTGQQEETTTTRFEETGFGKKGREDYATETENLVAANQAEVDVAKEQAKDEFNIKAAKLAMMNEVYAAREAVSQKATQDLDSRLDKLKTEVNALAEEKYEGFWHDKSTGQKVTAAIALFLGGLAQGVGKFKSNSALDIINQAKAQDFSAFKERQQRKIKAIEESRLEIGQKRKAIELELDKLDAREIAYDKIIDQQLKLIASKFQGEQAQAKADQFAAELRMRSAEKIANIAEKYKIEIETKEKRDLDMVTLDENGNAVYSRLTLPDGSPMQPSHLKAQGYIDVQNHTAARIEEIAKNNPEALQEAAEMVRMLEGLELAEKTSLPYIGGILGAISRGSGSEKGIRLGFSKNAQELVQRFETFMGRKLRYESGAAISVGEYIKEFRKFAVREGDKDLFVPKMEEIRNDLEGVRISTGRIKDNPLYFETTYTPKWEGRRVKPKQEKAKK